MELAGTGSEPAEWGLEAPRRGLGPDWRASGPAGSPGGGREKDRRDKRKTWLHPDIEKGNLVTSGERKGKSGYIRGEKGNPGIQASSFFAKIHTLTND